MAMLNSVIKVVVGFVLLPVQVHFIEPEDYLDAWWKLDEVVDVVVEEVGRPSEEVGDWADIKKQEDFEDQGGQSDYGARPQFDRNGI
jgi:hypothetical protein